MDTTPLGFDSILESPLIMREGIAASSTGEYVVSTAPGRGTYLEHKVEGGGKPIQILPHTSDIVGFFGRDIDLIAAAHHDVLRIINVHRMTIETTIKIKPGGLFVPRSGNSQHIGVVSPRGTAYLIDDEGMVHDTPLTISDEYDVLWSSNAYPAGYTWNDEHSASIYIRSTPHDKGATITSVHGINLFTTWKNAELSRHEVFFSTHDTPHVLKRAWSEDGHIIQEPVVTLPVGAVVDNVALLSNGRPAVVSGFHEGKSIAEIIPPERNISAVLKKIISNKEKSVSATCMGALSYVSWTQTPITPAIPAITNYSLPGHPRYDIEEGKPRYTQLKTGSVVSFAMPRTNRPHTINIPGGGHVYYRWVSPMAEKGFTAETALIVVDGNGTVSAGEYSPTVKMCYDLGIPVAVMPVTQQSDVKNTLEDTVMDIIDVADDIKKKNYAKNVTVLAEGELSQPALKTLSKRKTPIRNIVVYNPDVNVMKNKRQKKKHAITVVCDNEEQAQLYPQDITTRVIDSSSQEEQFISIVNIISDTV